MTAVRRGRRSPADGAASLQSALGQHQDGLADGGVDASQVDTVDGEKIVGHVFGGQQDQVAAQLAGTAELGGIGGDLIRKALPILAPIVMSYLAKKMAGMPGTAGGFGQGRPDLQGQPGQRSVQPGEVIHVDLPGAEAARQAPDNGGGLGSILGGLFGKKQMHPGRPWTGAGWSAKKNYGWTGRRWWAGRRRYSHTSPRTGSSSGMNA